LRSCAQQPDGAGAARRGPGGVACRGRIVAVSIFNPFGCCCEAALDMGNLFVSRHQGHDGMAAMSGYTTTATYEVWAKNRDPGCDRSGPRSISGLRAKVLMVDSRPSRWSPLRLMDYQEQLLDLPQGSLLQNLQRL